MMRWKHEKESGDGWERGKRRRIDSTPRKIIAGYILLAMLLATIPLSLPPSARAGDCSSEPPLLIDFESQEEQPWDPVGGDGSHAIYKVGKGVYLAKDDGPYDARIQDESYLQGAPGGGPGEFLGFPSPPNAVAFKPYGPDEIRSPSYGWDITFQEGQSAVSLDLMMALPRDVALPSSVQATLQAYGRIGIWDYFISQHVVQKSLQGDFSPDFGCLCVESSGSNIRKVYLEITSPTGWPDPGPSGEDLDIVEVVDNLRYTSYTPPCDTHNPNIQIISPKADEISHGEVIVDGVVYDWNDDSPGLSSLLVTAKDLETSEEVTFDFFAPWAAESVVHIPDADWNSYHKYYFSVKLILPGTGPTVTPRDVEITVRAEDWGCSGIPNSAEETVVIRWIAVPDTANLYIRGLEVTQGTTWVITPNAARGYHPVRGAGDDPSSGSDLTLHPFVWRQIGADGYLYDIFPLIRGRDTIVRLYPGLEGWDSDLPYTGVRAYLYGWKSCIAREGVVTDQGYIQDVYTIRPGEIPAGCDPGDELPGSPLSHDGWGETIAVWADTTFIDMRLDNEFTFDFRLPYSWVSERRIDLYAVIVGPEEGPECCFDNANRALILEMGFHESPNLNSIYTLYVNRERSPTTPANDDARDRLPRLMQIVEHLYPVAEFPWQDDFEPVSFPPCDDSYAGLAFGGHNTIIVDDPTCYYDGGTFGYALDHEWAIVAARGAGPAHEMGHLVNMKHTSGCHGEDGYDSQSYAHGGIGYPGWEPLRGPVDPVLRDTTESEYFVTLRAEPVGEREDCNAHGSLLAHAHDFMNYGSNFGDIEIPSGGGTIWVSPASFDELYTRLMRSPHNTPLESTRGETISEGALSVVGTIDGTTGRITHTFLWDTSDSYTLDKSDGDFTLRLLSGDGTILDETRFDAVTPEDLDEQRFRLRVPFPAETSRIELLRGAELLDAVDGSANPPEVSVTSPSTGDVWGYIGLTKYQEVTWDSSDDDNDELISVVQFRETPETDWRTIAIGDSPLEITTDSIPFSREARIRVLVSDGFHTSIDLSGRFSVVDKPPTVGIIEPESGELFRQGQVVTLRGYASDVDGPLASDACSWSSDVQGSLGHKLRMDTQLMAGIHTLTLTCYDTVTNVQALSVDVTVLPESRSPVEGDFFLSISNRFLSVQAGDSAKVSVELYTLTGSTNVTLSVDSLIPQGVNVEFAPSVGSSPFVSIVTFSAAPDAPCGLYSLELRATGENGVEHTATVLVAVSVTESPRGLEGEGPLETIAGLWMLWLGLAIGVTIGVIAGVWKRKRG